MTDDTAEAQYQNVIKEILQLTQCLPEGTYGRITIQSKYLAPQIIMFVAINYNKTIYELRAHAQGPWPGIISDYTYTAWKAKETDKPLDWQPPTLKELQHLARIVLSSLSKADMVINALFREM